MVPTQSSCPTLAPLAFSLSIRLEEAAPMLQNNAVDTSSLVIYPVLVGAVSTVACAGILFAFLPAWLSIPLAVWPAYQCFKFAKQYFEGGYVDERIRVNRNLLAKLIDSQDAGHFADVTADIVKAQYGKQKWAIKANAQRNQAEVDPYLYLAVVFTYAPGGLSLCARKVYDLLLAEVAPTQLQHVASD